MRRATSVAAVASIALGSLVTRSAQATTDLPGQYDARAVAIGGTGSSYVDSMERPYFSDPQHSTVSRPFLGRWPSHPFGPR